MFNWIEHRICNWLINHMKNTPLILHVGPARTGTTYLWELMIARDLVNSKVRFNIPALTVKFVKKLVELAGTPVEDSKYANYPVELLMDFASVLIKESKSFQRTGFDSLSADGCEHCQLAGHPTDLCTVPQCGLVFDNEYFHDALTQWYNHLNDEHDGLSTKKMSYAYTDPLISMPFTHLKHAYPEALAEFTRYNIQFGDHGHEDEHKDLPLMVFDLLGPIWWSGQRMDRHPGPELAAWVEQQLRHYPAKDRAKAYCDIIVPELNNIMLHYIDALAEHYSEVIIVAGHRDGEEHSDSLAKLYRGPAAKNPLGAQLLDGMEISIDEHYWKQENKYSTRSANTMGMQNLEEGMHTNGIQLYSGGYMMLDTIFNSPLPDNVSLRMYDTNKLHDPVYLNKVLPEIFAADCEPLPNKVNASPEGMHMKLLGDKNNYDYLKRINTEYSNKLKRHVI